MSPKRDDFDTMASWFLSIAIVIMLLLFAGAGFILAHFIEKFW